MIVRSGNLNMFSELDIPNSTKHDWLRKGTVEVVSLPELDSSADELLAEIQELKLQLAEDLSELAGSARVFRIETNRALICQACPC